MNRGYQYLGSGLDNVWLMNGYRLVADTYGDGVEITDLHGLHRAIGAALANKLAPLTGAELRFLRIEMDLSQKRLGALLGREAQTVALWEKGACAPDGVDYLVRHIYRQFIGERATYVEEVDRLRALDQRDYRDGFRYAVGRISLPVFLRDWSCLMMRAKDRVRCFAPWKRTNTYLALMARRLACYLLRVAEPRFRSRHGCTGLVVLPLLGRNAEPYAVPDLSHRRVDSTQPPIVLLPIP